MKNLSDHEGLAVWNERFASFNDALLKSWSVTFAATGSILNVLIEAQDRQSSSGWSFVSLRLSGVTSLRFCEGPKASYQVLSNGLHLLIDTGLVAIEFGDFIDTPESLSELLSSPCHAVGHMLEWDAQPVPRENQEEIESHA